MGGSCSMPLAAHARFTSGHILDLRAAWGDPDGQAALVQVQATAPVTDLEQAAAMGQKVAAQLRAGGAR
jgi:hydroxymethylbilane synthase